MIKRIKGLKKIVNHLNETCLFDIREDTIEGFWIKLAADKVRGTLPLELERVDLVFNEGFFNFDFYIGDKFYSIFYFKKTKLTLEISL